MSGIKIFKPVIQEEKTGCAIASVAVITKSSYGKVKKIANSIGIYAEDSNLWSKTDYIRRLLSEFKIKTGSREIPFKNWETLPNVALLATKWQKEQNKPAWHWCVFVREDNSMAVFDSNRNLKNNLRTDFERIKPKWFIEVKL